MEGIIGGLEEWCKEWMEGCRYDGRCYILSLLIGWGIPPWRVVLIYTYKINTKDCTNMCTTTVVS